jgi:hypothetical protein
VVLELLEVVVVVWPLLELLVDTCPLLLAVVVVVVVLLGPLVLELPPVPLPPLPGGLPPCSQNAGSAPPAEHAGITDAAPRTRSLRRSKFVFSVVMSGRVVRG